MDENKKVDIPENIDEIFDAAVFIVHNLPKEGPLSIANTEKLKFYSLYKQSTEGSCNKPRPPFWQPIERLKYDGWKSLNDMDSKLAKHIYVRKMQKMIDQVYSSHSMTDLYGGASNIDIEEMDKKLRPKFKLIGRELLSLDESKSVINELKNKSINNDENEIKSSIKSDDVISDDDEYIDAWETPIIDNKKSIIQHDNHNSNKNIKKINNIDNNIKLLTEQVKLLSNNLTEQNNIIKELLSQILIIKKSKGIGGLSWWMFMIIILWPFFIKYVYRFLFRFMFHFM